jgi:predicted RNase H-like nuclease (RuvC/YqgF family)
MYHLSGSGRIDDQIKHAKSVEELKKEEVVLKKEKGLLKVEVEELNKEVDMLKKQMVVPKNEVREVEFLKNFRQTLNKKWVCRSLLEEHIKL